jgi:hypothetical protein
LKGFKPLELIELEVFLKEVEKEYIFLRFEG